MCSQVKYANTGRVCLVFLTTLLLETTLINSFPTQNVRDLKQSFTEFLPKHAPCFIPYRVFNQE